MKTERLAIAFLLFFVGAAQILSMPRVLYPSDPVFSQAEAARFLNEGKLDFDYEDNAYFNPPGKYIVKNEVNGRFYSKYGIGNSIFFLIPLAAEKLFSGGKLPLRDSPNRVHFLNFFNLFLSWIAAFLLYSCARTLTHRPGVAVAWVITTFYCTFLWSYLRLQATEIFQIVLFSAFALQCLRWTRRKGSESRLWATVLLLVLVKTSYLTLVPVVAYFLYRDSRKLARSILPGIGITGILLAIQWWKFGSPFLTGYHQYATDLFRPSLSTWKDSVPGFGWSAHKSIFLYFPTLLLALPEFHRCRKENSRGWNWLLVSIGIQALYFFSFPGWTGDWCYGPRYLLPLATVLSLPAVRLFEKAWLKRKSVRTWLVSACVGACLAYSFFLQYWVNAFHPFAWFYVRAPLGYFLTPASETYFAKMHPATLNRLIWAHRNHLKDLPYIPLISSEVTEADWNRYFDFLRERVLQSNFMWFSEKSRLPEDWRTH